LSEEGFVDLKYLHRPAPQLRGFGARGNHHNDLIAAPRPQHVNCADRFRQGTLVSFLAPLAAPEAAGRTPTRRARGSRIQARLAATRIAVATDAYDELVNTSVRPAAEAAAARMAEIFRADTATPSILSA
jgi:hypothetical protein